MATIELQSQVPMGESTAEGIDQHEIDATFWAMVEGIQASPESEAASRDFAGKTAGRNDPQREFTQR